MTKAVLFQKSGQPVLFTDYAEYDTGTGYIVAENKEKGKFDGVPATWDEVDEKDPRYRTT